MKSKSSWTIEHLALSHLRVLPADPDAGVETGSVVRLHDVPPEHAARTHPAVVGTLGPGEPALGPAQGVTISVQESVLLLDAKPGVLILRRVHHFFAGPPIED